MPNGTPDFYEKELPVLESFFAPIAEDLKAFGAKHNLMLEKYYHQSPSWRFNFRHPNGGVASLDVMRDSPDSIKVGRCWWIDDYGTFSRSLRTDETPPQKLAEVDLNSFLEEQFNEVISWQKGSWTQVATGFERSWKPRGRKWLESYVEHYPEPKV